MFLLLGAGSEKGFMYYVAGDMAVSGSQVSVKGKGKAIPVTGHEGP
jgi:hypothetical protein